MTEPATVSNTRARLLALRADLLRQLAEVDNLDGGQLALLGHVGAALAAIDAEPGERAEHGVPMSRAVVTDGPGLPITLTLYGEDGKAAAVELQPIPAVMLANRLLSAALPKLPR
jgi:hypothetical protein